MLTLINREPNAIRGCLCTSSMELAKRYPSKRVACAGSYACAPTHVEDLFSASINCAAGGGDWGMEIDDDDDDDVE